MNETHEDPKHAMASGTTSETRRAAGHHRRAPAIGALVVGFCFALGQAGINYSWTNSRSSALLPLVGFLVSVACIAAMTRRASEVADHPERAWLVAAIVLGISYSVVLPVGGTPDERYHYASTYSYSDLLLGGRRDGKGIDMRVCDRDLFENDDEHVDLSDYRDAQEEPSLFASGEDSSIVYVQIGRGLELSNNWPQVRMPAAIGIALGRLIGLNAYVTYLLGKLASLAYVLALVYVAIRVTPVGKSIFMVASLLPMTLSLAGSYSYDAGTIALAFLLTAACLKGIYEKGPISRGAIAALVVLSALIVPAKAVYTLLALLVFAIPAERFGSRRARSLFLCSIVGTLSVMAFVSQLASISAMVGTSSADPGARHYTVSWLLAHPLGAMSLFARTLGCNSGDWVLQMVTGPLGPLQASLAVPAALSFAFLGLLAYSCLLHGKDKNVPSSRDRLLFAALAALMLAAVMAALGLGWTELGAALIEGVQGRYLLPFLPIVLLALRPNSVMVEGTGLPANHAYMCLASSMALNAVCLSCVYAGVLMG